MSLKQMKCLKSPIISEKQIKTEIVSDKQKFQK